MQKQFLPSFNRGGGSNSSLVFIDRVNFHYEDYVLSYDTSDGDSYSHLVAYGPYPVDLYRDVMNQSFTIDNFDTFYTYRLQVDTESIIFITIEYLSSDIDSEEVLTLAPYFFQENNHLGILTNAKKLPVNTVTNSFINTYYFTALPDDRNNCFSDDLSKYNINEIVIAFPLDTIEECIRLNYATCNIQFKVTFTVLFQPEYINLFRYATNTTTSLNTLKTDTSYNVDYNM